MLSRRTLCTGAKNRQDLTEPEAAFCGTVHRMTFQIGAYLELCARVVYLRKITC